LFNIFLPGSLIIEWLLLSRKLREPRALEAREFSAYFYDGVPESALGTKYATTRTISFSVISTNFIDFSTSLDKCRNASLEDLLCS
jgi:hypothetical protein